MILEKIDMKAISLFSGCGGLDWGFKKEGIDIIWANDFIKDVCESYSANFGTHIICADISSIKLNKIPKADLIIGGPPCQSFSLVGKRSPNDIRSQLVWTYLNIIKHIRPKIFLMENVTGIKSAKNQDGTKVIDNLITAFKKIGYNVDTYTLNAADYGVPQRRKRVFLIGNRMNIHISPPSITHSEKGEGFKKWVSSFEALSDLGKTSKSGEGHYKTKPLNSFQKDMRKNSGRTYQLHIIPYSSSKDLEIIKHVKVGGNYMDVPDNIATKRILNFKKTGGRTTTYGRLDPEKPAYTLNTHFNRPNVGCNIHYKDNRLITIREGLRLQSFPDDFIVLSSNKRNYYLQVGNAVPPLLSLAWAKQIKKYL